MDEKILNELTCRNDRIIAAVLEKAKRVCPNSIALIGISGSFCTGDIHEKSDLDLFIVINDDDGWKIGSCFIIGDVAHDIYCTYWAQLEQMTEYRDPYVVKLMDMKFVYCADEKYMERYMQLREKLTKRLAEPLCSEDIENCKKHLLTAKQSLADAMLTDSTAECRFAASGVVYYCEFIIYMLNKCYIKRGVKRIPEEIALLPSLPPCFTEYHSEVVNAVSAAETKIAAIKLLKCTEEFLSEAAERVSPKEAISADALGGSYEEIFSNWHNKMHYAVRTEDKYLSFMTASACTEFYSEMYGEYDIPKLNAYDGFDPESLTESAAAFDKAMHAYRALYDRTGARVKNYSSIDEFERDYLGEKIESTENS